MKPDNPQAFPMTALNPWKEPYLKHAGMTLRDWFAGQAMAAMLNGHAWNSDELATNAYLAADAMLATRATNAQAEKGDKV